MKKPNPINLSNLNRDAMVQGKYGEIRKILFESGLKVGEIANIIKACNDQLNGVSIGVEQVIAEGTEGKENA